MSNISSGHTDWLHSEQQHSQQKQPAGPWMTAASVPLSEMQRIGFRDDRIIIKAIHRIAENRLTFTANDRSAFATSAVESGNSSGNTVKQLT
nr:hypothetical protein Iba_chr01bCG0920 [Ipomoea batatas]